MTYYLSLEENVNISHSVFQGIGFLAKTDIPKNFNFGTAHIIR